MLTRIFGDRPFIAISKLLALCLLVGLALTAIGIDPSHLAGSLQRVMHRAANLLRIMPRLLSKLLDATPTVEALAGEAGEMDGEQAPGLPLRPKLVTQYD